MSLSDDQRYLINAAKNCGHKYDFMTVQGCITDITPNSGSTGDDKEKEYKVWNPIESSDDAMRLAANYGVFTNQEYYEIFLIYFDEEMGFIDDGSGNENIKTIAMRRAIVRTVAYSK